jgi:DNA-binding CsgD family transcriptional regulator
MSLAAADDLVCGTHATGDVETAVRRLVELALDQPPGGDPEGVLVDLVVGGARCVVTTVPPAPSVSSAGTAPGRGPTHGPAPAAAVPLSPREQEIARMVGAGYTNKEIAAVLEISSWTVSTHLRRIFGKLDVGTRAAMVARLLAGRTER